MDDQLVESLRAEAAAEVEDLSLHRLQTTVDRVINDSRLHSLESVKTPLRKTKKGMRTCSYYLCDKCNQPIIDCDDGYVFHGNVYVANPSERGGLIGNNFPKVVPGTLIDVEDVEENVFCHKCVMVVLGLDKHYEPKVRKRSPNSAPLEDLEAALQQMPTSVATGLDSPRRRRRRGESGQHWQNPFEA